MPEGVPNKRYTPEFKKMVMETMHQEHWTYVETGNHFEVAKQRVTDWELIYLTKGPGSFQIEAAAVAAKGVLQSFLKRWKRIC